MPFTSTLSFSTEIPYSNNFNTHCDICSHPISQSDINVLQPCFCGPFHGYCITNLESQARGSKPSNPNPHLTCPRCRQIVTAVNYDFLHDHPRASRVPFTIPIQSSPQPVLPTAIHDTCPLPPNPPKHLPSFPLYPNPATPFHPPPADFTPSAPPAPHDDPPLPLGINDAFPPQQQHFERQPSHHVQTTPRPAPHFQKRPMSNFCAESAASPPGEGIHLPRPHDGILPSPPSHNSHPRNCFDSNHSHLHRNSPKSVVICRKVNEEDVRKGLFGDDVYKAYVEGKASVLASAELSKFRKEEEDVNVKVNMDLHVYHHYRPPTKSAALSHHRKATKERERRKMSPVDKTWWNSLRTPSRLDSREGVHNDEQYRVRGGSSRRS